VTEQDEKRLADIRERLNGTTPGLWHCADGEWEVYSAEGDLLADCAAIATKHLRAISLR